MPDDLSAATGVDALRARLTAIREEQPEIEPKMLTEVIRAVLTTISDDLTSKEAALLAEVEELGRTITAAKSEIAALRVDDITGACHESCVRGHNEAR